MLSPVLPASLLREDLVLARGWRMGLRTTPAPVDVAVSEEPHVNRVLYPSQVIPAWTHLWQTGRFSSHFLWRLLQVQQLEVVSTVK